MKKLCLVVFLAFFLAGCGTTGQQTEFWKHPTVFKSWDHLLFSWFDYRAPTVETGEKSQDQEWWGQPVEGP